MWLARPGVHGHVLACAALLTPFVSEVKALFNAADKQQTGHLEYSAIEKLMRVAFGLEIEPDQLRVRRGIAMGHEFCIFA